MIGIMVVTHGKLSEELVRATEHVVGTQTAFRAVSIEVEDDVEARRAEIRQTVKEADQGDGVIILTDMFGGTPSNLALSNLTPGKVDVVGGVNLPMLIHLAQVREELSLKQAVQAACDAGQRYIRIGSEIMSKSR
jgi:PTS system mannose-specific IIA component